MSKVELLLLLFLVQQVELVESSFSGAVALPEEKSPSVISSNLIDTSSLGCVGPIRTSPQGIKPEVDSNDIFAA